MIKRRQFMGQAAAGVGMTAGLATMPQFTALASATRRYELIAAPAAQALAGNDFPETGLLAYNGQSPGPILTARKGEMLEVAFTNNLAEPTTVHWHGIRNLFEMDGVPGLTQPPVEPGETFTYRFPVNDAGTFWYHAHQMSWRQVAMGLYGGLIVYDDDEVETEHDQVLVFDDWRLDENYAIDEASFGSLHDWSHAGRLGNWLTVNGQSQPEITLPASGKVRLRLINAANARPFTLGLTGRGLTGRGLTGGAPMQVISTDGAGCTPFTTDSLRLGPGQRYDVLIDAADAAALNEISFQDPLMAARFTPAGKSASVQPPTNLSPDPAPWYQLPDH